MRKVIHILSLLLIFPKPGELSFGVVAIFLLYECDAFLECIFSLQIRNNFLISDRLESKISGVVSFLKNIFDFFYPTIFKHLEYTSIDFFVELGATPIVWSEKKSWMDEFFFRFCVF